MSLVRTRPGLVATIMPTAITRWTRVMAWLLVITNIGIVGTGGLVRLTGSGMGCETWPYCTEGSLTPTPEMGIHGLIEFGNRTLTGVLVIVALLAFLSVVRLRATRRELPVLSFLVGLGIIVQAVVGGITVWLHLHPSIVGLHYLISAALVALATAFLVRVYATPGPRARIVPRAYAITTHVTTLAMPSTPSRPAAISPANSRGFAPTTFDSLSAALEAQSPWSRFFGRSSGRSAAVIPAEEPSRRASASGAMTASRAAERAAGSITLQV